MNQSGTIPPNTLFTFTVTPEDNLSRLDLFISKQFPHYSRSFFQRLIEDKCITVNETNTVKAGTKVKTGDRVVVHFPPKPIIATQALQDNLGVKPVHITDHFLILEKPAGLMVHPPSEYTSEPTLVDWIKHHYQDISAVGYIDRPGIVHRLDKDTSGLIIVPRTNYAFMQLGELFRKREINKTYLAVVDGHPDKSGVIDIPIGRDSVTRTKMKTYPTVDPATNRGIRHATTYYTVLEYFDNAALLEVKPITGRTHQIRVHLAAIGHPIIGDKVYGKPSRLIARQALHAYRLHFIFDGVSYSFEAKPPKDLIDLIERLQKSPTNRV